jgi:SAM-dependent methyltransferase
MPRRRSQPTPRRLVTAAGLKGRADGRQRAAESDTSDLSGIDFLRLIAAAEEPAMTNSSENDGPQSPATPPVDLDTSVAHPARVYDYWLGGSDNFAADREAAEQAIAANPMIVPGVRTNRAFLRRAVSYLAVEAGIRQFLDIGTGLPSASNTHQVAQAAAPDSRIVYVDNDPIVLVHARALLTGTPEGATAYLDADLRDPGAILARASDTLDFGLPVAVLLLAILQLIPDDDDPHALVAQLMDAVVPGSYLVVSHPASDVLPEEMAEMERRLNERQREVTTFRPRAEVGRLFDGLSVIEPGVVQPHRWRPEPGGPIPEEQEVTAWSGVGRKG